MNRAAKIVLLPVSGLYGLIVRARRFLYRKRILRTHDLDAPVISVGNLTAGGTGKTPLVEWIAKELAKSDRRVCILTRGYGRANENERVVVSDGKQILATVERAGDEPFMLAEHLLQQAAVISDSDRAHASRWAIENLGSDVFLLDDGFQHLRIARQFDVVTIDGSNPWGNGWLLPVGKLREPPAELRRADCVVITRADEPDQNNQLIQELSRFADKPIFVSRMAISDVRPARIASKDLKHLPREQIKATAAAAFCAIGNPEAFFSTLRRGGYRIVSTASFRDHHNYQQSDADGISRQSIERGAKLLLTTAKDEVKLRSLSFELPCYVVDVALEIEDECKLAQMIDDAARPTA